MNIAGQSSRIMMMMLTASVRVVPSVQPSKALNLTAHTRNMASSNAANAPSASELNKLSPSPDALSSKSTKSQLSPPPESKEGIWLRRAAIFSFWSVVLLIGLPLWWKTTAVYRAELPLQDMTAWAEGKVGTLIPMNYPY